MKGSVMEEMMSTAVQILFKLTATGILGFGIYSVWKMEIDVGKLFRKPFESLLVEKKRAKLEIDFGQIAIVRYGDAQNGNFCFLMYNMRFINSSGENLTLKKFYLRVANSEIESTPVA